MLVRENLGKRASSRSSDMLMTSFNTFAGWGVRHVSTE
jgi:hypothetical protein